MKSDLKTVLIVERNMTIKRGGMAEPISGKIYKREIPSHCPRCEEQGVKNNNTILKVRLDYFLADKDLWKQCYNCGTPIAIHDIAKKGELTTDVERITTKFPTQKETEKDYHKPKHQRGFNERLDQESEIKDPEVRQDLKKGAKLISYSER